MKVDARDDTLPPPDHPDEVSREFGERVRGLRERAELTLEELSRLSGVSRAMLSKVERGEKSPTIGVAKRISRALNTSLSFLAGGQEERRAVAIVRKDQRHVFKDGETGFERHLLSPPIAGGGVELLFHYLPAGTSTGMLPPYPVGTEKHVVVTDGELARIIHRTARNRPRPPNTWARDFIAKNFIKQPIRIVVSDSNGLALIAHFS